MVKMDIGNFPGTFPLKGIIIGLVCIGIIAGSVTAAARMAASKKPPVKKEKTARKMAVASIPAVKQDIALTVTGYGQTDPFHLAQVSPACFQGLIKFSAGFYAPVNTKAVSWPATIYSGLSEGIIERILLQLS